MPAATPPRKSASASARTRARTRRPAESTSLLGDGFAVGVATAPGEAVEADELCLLADTRLYEAKAG